MTPDMIGQLFTNGLLVACLIAALVIVLRAAYTNVKDRAYIEGHTQGYQDACRDNYARQERRRQFERRPQRACTCKEQLGNQK